MTRPLRSFPPIGDARSRILILGSMPGPVALQKREYYGFPGNHFWKILPALFSEAPLREYSQKKNFLIQKRIALWDVLAECVRTGASDHSIRRAKPNDLPALLRRCPQIRMIYLNGRAAERFYRRYFAGVIRLPIRVLPSSSPAHASLTLAQKTERWKVLLEGLAPVRSWC